MINIHTHQVHSFEKEYQLELLNLPLSGAILDTANQPFSIGLHPWHILEHPNWLEELSETIEKMSTNQCFKAIGECGLDKNTAISLDLQTSVLNLHFDLASKFNKPIIIHCVAAFNEIIQWKKSKKKAALMLIHGFEKKLQLLNNLLKEGFYVSFGAALCKNRPTLEEAFRAVPMDHFFLETDDQTDYSIETIYEAAARIKGVAVEVIENQIAKNFKTFFGGWGE